MRFQVDGRPGFVSVGGQVIEDDREINPLLTGGKSILFLRYDLVKKVPTEWAQFVVLSGDKGVGGFDLCDFNIDLKANVGISAFGGIGSFREFNPSIEISYAGDRSKLKPLIEEGFLPRSYFKLSEEKDYGVSGRIGDTHGIKLDNWGMFVGDGRYLSRTLMQVIGSFMEEDSSGYLGEIRPYNSFLNRNRERIEIVKRRSAS